MKNGPLTRMDTGLLDVVRVCVKLLTDTNVRALARQAGDTEDARSAVSQRLARRLDSGWSIGASPRDLASLRRRMTALRQSPHQVMAAWPTIHGCGPWPPGIVRANHAALLREVAG